MANIILVAGTHHGGWYWEPITEELRQLGHAVFAPTLSGLDDENPYVGEINLDTHIDDVIRVIEENHLTSVVLVGSSYGGMVITGAADRTTAEIEKLIYLDACLPLPGQSEWDLISDELRSVFTHSNKDGLGIEVPAEWLTFRPRLMPHPLATKTQPLNYSIDKFQTHPKVYVHAANGFGPNSDHFFRKGYERIKDLRDWTTHVLPGGHDIATDLPNEVIKIICAT